MTGRIRESQREHLGNEFADLPRSKIDDRSNLPIQQFLKPVIFSDLRRRPLCSNDRTEINHQFKSRLSGFWKWYRLDNPSDANIHTKKFLKVDLLAGGRVRVVIYMHTIFLAPCFRYASSF